MKIIIKHEELILRKFTIEDVPLIYSMSQEEGIKKWMPDQVYSNEQEAKDVVNFLMTQYIENPKPDKAPFVLGVVLKNTNELIGHVGLSSIAEGVEIGYAISKKHHGYGYATKAVKVMIKWAFTHTNLSSIWGVIKINNLASCRVLEKSGFKYISTDKERGRKLYHYRKNQSRIRNDKRLSFLIRL